MLPPQKKSSGAEIEELIALLAKLPGLGPRSARRAALHLIKKREQLLLPLARALGVAADKIAICKECGNIDTQQPCAICADAGRDASTICVVEEVGDLWALERAAIVRSRYHVLGGTLSPLDGRGPDDLFLVKLMERARQPGVNEIILALNATVEGQSTAHYIAAELEGLPLKVTRLARGVPIGGELDYLDEGTLAAAIKLRQPI
ncbi:recombinase RecR [Rhodomicrobium udaipurense JA643]|jgi:recombination protein RecR|uniref:Recombination protein RecR n=1 Tax=Rhodomicrobium udaipurense TaxID=1202716 RepID=A0A8I1GEQ1_9HYPH|nr:recombination mediator RecR [Rhodomicrobium udaipurense]KAI95840.1 recombinase RecR [Rhodomicrobium udaipurense JA643]MBJ7543173.1 recombination protein RecR [Rhodomicrobium udaipurense]